ncbi:hypothetical protein [Uliginosibacterium sp. H1]|uniref:hypothetical protein n=1 Tax=Uliginosibacterium sp. H1 TaxID=3114757 RepID=UPI002E197D18|nr:hypothetical protein [Uliginosibacterium sp. H1]
MMALRDRSPAYWRTAAEIWFWRQGLGPVLLAGLLVLAVVVWAVLVPAESKRLEEVEQRQAEAERLAESGANEAAAAASRPSALAAFRKILGDPEDGNVTIRQIFNIAQEAGVRLAQAEYRRLGDTSSAYSQMQVALPVKGSYSSIRRFSLLLLARQPSISIDQINLRRESNGGPEVEGQFILSVWQQPVPGAAVAQAPQGAAR